MLLFQAAAIFAFSVKRQRAENSSFTGFDLALGNIFLAEALRIERLLEKLRGKFFASQLLASTQHI